MVYRSSQDFPAEVFKGPDERESAQEGQRERKKEEVSVFFVAVARLFKGW
jgi:hypothetical protein